MLRGSYPIPLPTALWVCLCAFCGCAGWILSGLHQLNARGYALTLGIALIGLFVFRRQLFTGSLHHLNWARYRRRFTRLFPLAFLLLAGLAILGGVLHAPSNYDGLAPISRASNAASP